MDDERVSGGAIAALILGIVAWMSFLSGFLLSSDPEIFFFLAFVCGAIALGLGIHARRTDAVLIGAAGALAGQAALIATLMVWLVWATGVLVFLVLFALFVGMASSSASASGPSCDCSCGGCCNGCSGPDCASCCDCGSCCDCASCCECGSGCCCATVGIIPFAAQAMTSGASWATRLSRAFAHHPDTSAYAADVYRVAGARFCIGCFTTYPVFLAVIGLTLAFPLPWASALFAGVVAASAQAISSAGLARRWWMKAGVKTLFGAGLALVVAGVRAAPWDPRAKTLALAFALALALVSAIPRARRMRAASACACGEQPGRTSQ